MGVFTRFVDIVNSNLNAALDSAEKPEKMLRMIIQEMEEALVEVRSQAAQFIAEKKQVERQYDRLSKEMSDWQSKAELAMSKEREDLARQALVAKSDVAEQLADLENNLKVIQESINKITEDANSLQNKLSEAKQKQASFAKREKAAVVQLNTRRQLDNSKIDAVNHKYEQLNQKIESLESQVEAYDLTSNPSLTEQFNQLEADAKVEAELEALKKKVANA